MFLYCWNVCKKTKYKAGTRSERTATNMREVSVMCPLWHHRRRRTHRSTGVEYFFSFFFSFYSSFHWAPLFLSNVGMEGNERTRVHVGCANYVYHPHSKESHIWNCVQKADKSVLVAAKWWARVFSGERNSLDDGRRFCVFAASRVLKGIESIEDWMRAN